MSYHCSKPVGREMKQLLQVFCVEKFYARFFIDMKFGMPKHDIFGLKPIVSSIEIYQYCEHCDFVVGSAHTVTLLCLHLQVGLVASLIKFRTVFIWFCSYLFVISMSGILSYDISTIRDDIFQDELIY